MSHSPGSQWLQRLSSGQRSMAGSSVSCCYRHRLGLCDLLGWPCRPGVFAVTSPSPLASPTPSPPPAPSLLRAPSPRSDRRQLSFGLMATDLSSAPTPTTTLRTTMPTTGQWNCQRRQRRQQRRRRRRWRRRQVVGGQCRLGQGRGGVVASWVLRGAGCEQNWLTTVDVKCGDGETSGWTCCSGGRSSRWTLVLVEDVVEVWWT